MLTIGAVVPIHGYLGLPQWIGIQQNNTFDLKSDRFSGDGVCMVSVSTADCSDLARKSEKW
jgi:hypothetical protein